MIRSALPFFAASRVRPSAGRFIYRNQSYRMAEPSAARSLGRRRRGNGWLRFLDEGLETTQYVVPFGGDVIEAAAGGLQPARLQLEDAFAPAPGVAHQPGTSQRVQMLGHGLAAATGILAEAGARFRP